MSESRHLTASQSFNGSSSASIVPRPLKRRLTETPDLNFFTPAAQSFKPRPYTPNGTSAPTKPLPTTRNHSSLTNLAQPIQAMDPSPSDPLALFLHPPFTNFPDSHLHPEGISYALMAANAEWFLDAADFVSTTPKTDGRDVISYPPQLEPPRGWCPAKKKDLRALGAGGWPEGEEPRLRCTFCRRTYAGVNAKSMWRRHVYEKHKIAMANRREGSDRVRGRVSNKENRHAYSEGHSDDGGRRTMKLEPTSPQDNCDPHSHSPSSHFRSYAPAGDDFCIPSAPYIEQNEFSVPTMSVDFSQSQLIMPSISPPLTPRSLSPKAIRRSLSEPASPSPKRSEAVIPESPYNPLLTPSFRHSPPRLPLHHPWRFSSPSHPLYSEARELSLGMIVRGGTSPSAKHVSVIDSSPISMLNTPAIRYKAKGNIVDSDNTDFLDSSPIAVRPSPHPISSDRIDESPLNRHMRRKNLTRQKSAFSGIGNNWFPGGSDTSFSGLVGSSDPNELLTPTRMVGGGDMFGSLSPWVEEPQSVEGKEGSIAPLSSPGRGSPVLRSRQLREEYTGANESNLVGLGFNLIAQAPNTLEYQTLDEFSPDEMRGADFNVTYQPSPEDERDAAEVDGVLLCSRPLQNFGLDRAHTLMAPFDVQDSNEQYESSAPPFKRRKITDAHY